MASETHMRPCGKHFRSVCVVISALIAVPGVYWTAVQGYTGAAVLYTVCMIPVLAAMAMLLAEELRGRIRFPLLLAAMGATLLASLPLVVKNYAFHDDWWSVCAQAPDNAVSTGHIALPAVFRCAERRVPVDFRWPVSVSAPGPGRDDRCVFGVCVVSISLPSGLHEVRTLFRARLYAYGREYCGGGSQRLRLDHAVQSGTGTVGIRRPLLAEKPVCAEICGCVCGPVFGFLLLSDCNTCHTCPLGGRIAH